MIVFTSHCTENVQVKILAGKKQSLQLWSGGTLDYEMYILMYESCMKHELARNDTVSEGENI